MTQTDHAVASVVEDEAPPPRKAGLGFLPAFTIKSAPYPPPPPDESSARSHYPSLPAASSAYPGNLESGPNSIPLPRNRYPQGYPSYTQWKEWHINPTQHGPEGSTGPPVFVPSTLKYDELGRSIIDGVGVEVDTGEQDEREGKEDGEKVAEWYSALAGSSRGTSGAVTSTVAEAGPSRPRVIPGGVIDLAGDDEEDLSPPPLPPPPIRVHRNEWFIRRALAKSAPAIPSRPPPSSSISTLLNIPPTQNRSTEPVYVLGPDHIGHQILRQRLGWGGGGLGRPEGWEPAAEAEEREVPDGSREDAIVVDDSEEGSAEEEMPTLSGPGRTAPIATALKLDRLGLGHRLSTDRPKRKGKEVKEGEGRKKVTHTHEEIIEAQRRAKYTRAGAVKPGGEVLGKKGKIKWKEKDKKERDERRRMIAALND